MTLINETVAVWVSPAGAPVRLVWRARRFRVSDTPTPLTASSSLPDELLYFLTHPPRPVAPVSDIPVGGGRILDDLVIPDTCLNNPRCPHRA